MTFLRDDLKLELNEDKTLVTHARTNAARFLSYDITVQHRDDKISRGGRIHRATNGKIALRVPPSVIKQKCTPYLTRGQPAHLPSLMNLSDYSVVSLYGAQYRGIVQYYLLASNVWRLNRVQWVMSTSMLKTLAAKHRSSVTKMAKKHKTTLITPNGPRKCFEARLERAGMKTLVGRFGGISLTRQRKAIINDRLPRPVTQPRRRELIDRLRRKQCELCDERTHVEVHQIRKLADLAPPGPAQPVWAQRMAKMRRKTLIVCPSCHDSIHKS